MLTVDYGRWSQDPDIDDQAKRFVTYLQGLSPHQAMRKAGMLSKHFWLK